MMQPLPPPERSAYAATASRAAAESPWLSGDARSHSRPGQAGGPSAGWAVCGVCPRAGAAKESPMIARATSGLATPIMSLPLRPDRLHPPRDVLDHLTIDEGRFHVLLGDRLALALLE